MNSEHSPRALWIFIVFYLFLFLFPSILSLNPSLHLSLSPSPTTALISSAGVGLVNALGPSVPGGQPNAASINPPSQIDPSSIERAYAALGLTYQGTQMPPQGPPGMPGQAMQGPAGMRALNSMGE